MNEREFGWEDTIENDSPEFIILAGGDYNFEVVSFERARHAGSEKMPPCNKAIVHVKINSPQGDVTIKHNLFLHTKTEGFLCAFFMGIGQRKKGEKLKMDWNRVIGSRGVCKVEPRAWKDKNGEEKYSNEIKEFYEPNEVQRQPVGQQAPQYPQQPQQQGQQPSQQQNWNQGKF
jgi:hypothetical protein